MLERSFVDCIIDTFVGNMVLFFNIYHMFNQNKNAPKNYLKSLLNLYYNLHELQT